MKIFYHSADNDGRASASIIYGEYGIMAMMTENDFIGYDYNKPYELPEFKEGEPWYFVDISLNPEIYGIIEQAVKAGCRVVHIDHHRNFEFIDNKLNNDQKAIMDKVVKFYNVYESATLLSWIYVNIPQEYRLEPMTHKYEFEENYSHFSIDGMNWVRVPYGFRLVNDQDVRHDQFTETRAFTAGVIELGDTEKEVPEWFKRFRLKERGIHPMSKIWDLIQNDNMRFVNEIIQMGTELVEKDEAENAELRKTAFEIEMELDGEKYNVICIKTDKHGGRVIGDLINDHDAYCRYNFDEEMGKWFYTFYSRSEGKFLPCHLMCQHIDPNGGGHLHAAGCTSQSLYFKEPEA